MVGTPICVAEEVGGYTLDNILQALHHNIYNILYTLYYDPKYEGFLERMTACMEGWSIEDTTVLPKLSS